MRVGRRKVREELQTLTGEPILGAIGVSNVGVQLSMGFGALMAAVIAIHLLAFAALAWAFVAALLWSIAFRIFLSYRARPFGLVYGGVLGFSYDEVFLASNNRWTSRANHVVNRWPRSKVTIAVGSRSWFNERRIALRLDDGTVVRLETVARRDLEPFLELQAPAIAAGTPAGWYADPLAPRGARYWDGQQWTEHVVIDPWAPRT